MIVLNDIIKIYGKNDSSVKALNKVSLNINQGDSIAIMGVSGSGKSTLLNIIGCIDKPTSGTYHLSGENVSEFGHYKLAKLRNNYFGFVVQNFALIDDYTVYQNIKVPLDYTKLGRKEKKRRIHEITKKIGIYEKLDKLPSELSGGQCQRVAIARALVNNPDVLLADEPTGSLDQKTGSEIMDLFLSLNKEGKTILVITHDPRVAEYCNKRIQIEDGKIINKKNN